MAINVGRMIVGDKTVVETPPSPTKMVMKSLKDIRNKAQSSDKRLNDPKHLKLHEIDEINEVDKKVSRYMLDMYNNELISFDK